MALIRREDALAAIDAVGAHSSSTLVVKAKCYAVVKTDSVVPTVDAVEVVRCRDCRYYRREPSHVRPDADVVWCDKHNDREDRINLAAVDDDWFCADGERRDDDG